MRLLVVRCLAFAVVQALIRARGSSGALRSMWAGRCSVSASVLRSLGRWVAGSVLIEYDRAVRRSKAMMGTRSRCSWPSRVSCASARKLFFFQRKEGVRSGKGARACG